MLRARNTVLEKYFPKISLENSPSKKVGSKPQQGFEKVMHQVPMLSLSNAFSMKEIEEFMDRMMMKWEEGEFEDVQAFSREVEDGIKLYSNRPKKKSVGLGGRPKGSTKRTIDRYKKVFHQFEILNKKYSSKTKAELYELLATRDYDGKSYKRKTIRNIIEDKKYNLIPSQ